MCEFRVYIDESGDHTYRQLQNLSSRYLGLTAAIIRKDYYDSQVIPALERLKRTHFTYDPDAPPILERRTIIKRRSAFGVLRESQRNVAWETDLLSFYRALIAQIFTVTVDKQSLHARFSATAWDPYHYALAVLLNRVRGWLNWGGRGWQADVMPEARGHREDAQLQAAYDRLRSAGTYWRTASEYRSAYPRGELLLRRKEFNVTGLQIVDLLAAGLKTDVLVRHGKPVANPPGRFDQVLVNAVQAKINRWGRCLLE